MTIEAAVLKLRLAIWDGAVAWTSWWHWRVTAKRDQAWLDQYEYEWDQSEALRKAAEDDPEAAAEYQGKYPF